MRWFSHDGFGSLFNVGLFLKIFCNFSFVFFPFVFVCRIKKKKKKNACRW